MKTFALTGLDLHEYVSGFVRIWPPDLSGCSGHIIFLFIGQSLDRYRHTLDFPPNFSNHLLQIDTLNIPNEPFTKKSCRKAETFFALIKNIFAFVSTKAKNPAYPARLLAPHQSHQSHQSCQPGPQNRCTRRTCARWTRKLISFKS